MLWTGLQIALLVGLTFRVTPELVSWMIVPCSSRMPFELIVTLPSARTIWLPPASSTTTAPLFPSGVGVESINRMVWPLSERIIRSRGAVDGVWSWPFHRKPITIGKLTSPSSNMITASSPTSGIRNSPRSCPAMGAATGAQLR